MYLAYVKQEVAVIVRHKMSNQVPPVKITSALLTEPFISTKITLRHRKYGSIFLDSVYKKKSRNIASRFMTIYRHHFIGPWG